MLSYIINMWALTKFVCCLDFLKFSEILANRSHTPCEYFGPYQTTPSAI